MLRFAVPLNDGETLTSFCSRLASRCFCLNAVDFCRDMGITFKSVIAGQAESVQLLAELGGAPLERVEASAMRMVKSGVAAFVSNGNLFMNATLRRSRLFMCPHCVSDDIERNPELGAEGPFGRKAWQIAAIRTCAIHDVALMDMSEWCASIQYTDRSDLAFAVKQMLNRGRDVLHQAVEAVPSPFERYLFSRLNHHADSDPIRPPIPIPIRPVIPTSFRPPIPI